MPSIIEQYRYLHSNGWFPGFSLRRHIPELAELVRKHEAKTLLDYGCGKASCWLKEGAVRDVGLKPALYDPGWKDFAKRPAGPFDGVVCTDVLEHVEDPEAVIADILGYATKFALIAISCKPSPPKKKLPDGRPLHIQVHEPQWWKDRIKADFPVYLRFDVDEAG